VQVIVKGKHFQVPDDVKRYAEDKVGHTERLFPDAVTRAEVVIGEEKNPRIKGHFVCEVTMPVNGGRVLRAKATATEPTAAVDLVVDKVETQVRKLKGKTLTRRDRPVPADVAAEVQIEEAIGSLDAALSPIARRKRFDGEPMSEAEAVHQLDLVDHDFFLFRNADADGHVALVYRRDDGSFGLIELD
jgi:putative sigma-54 modulation protein